MMENLIRDYENPELPLERRLPSLAKRFPCLRGADGLDPWSPYLFHTWLQGQERDSGSWHAGHLVLNLLGEGPWASFDAVDAIRHLDDESRAVLASWVRCWR